MKTFKECIEKMRRYRLQNRKHKKLGICLQDITSYRQAQAIIGEGEELKREIIFNPAKEYVMAELADIMIISLDFMIREGWTEEEVSRAIEYKMNLRFGEEDETMAKT